MLKTNKTEESVPDESPACASVCVCVCALLEKSLMLSHEELTLKKLQDALLSKPHDFDKYAILIGLLLSFCTHSACTR